MIRMWDRVWHREGGELRCGQARILTERKLGWAQPRGAVIQLGTPAALRQLEALVRAEQDDDAALLAWLHGRGLAVSYGDAGVVIGTPDPGGLTLPLTFRASGKTLAAAVRDLAGRL